MPNTKTPSSTPEQERDLPSPIQTRWVAIAGGACSGKTTISTRLQKRLGWEMIPDYGRQVFGDAIEQGKTPKDFAANSKAYQDKISTLYLNGHSNHGVRDRVISDYGLPCVYAWYKAKGIEPLESLVRGCDEWRYDKVFMLSPLPMKVDKVREELVELRETFLKEVKRAYRNFGYDVIDVPLFNDDPEISIAKRLSFIVSELKKSAEPIGEITQSEKEDKLRNVA